MTTPDIDANVMRALYTNLSQWSPPGGQTVVYPLQKFKPGQSPYIRITLLRNTPARLTINKGGIHQLQGILQANFVYPVNAKTVAEPVMMAHAGSLIEYFKSGTTIPVSGKRIEIPRRPEIGAISITADRVQVPVSIGWRIFD